MAKKIYVGKLAENTSDEDLRVHFSKAGKVILAEVAVNRLTGEREKFGYVQMSNDTETTAALGLNNSLLKKSNITVKEAHFLDQDRRDYPGYRNYRR